MKHTKLLITLAIPIVTCSMASGAVLWTDNFDVADTVQIEMAPAGARISGTLAVEVGNALQVFGSASNGIEDNRLYLGGSGGVRFGPQTDRFNWATSTAASDITTAGGMTVSYDWRVTNQTSSEWHAFNFGTNNNDGSTVNNGSTDYGVLIRKTFDGGGNLVQGFDNGTSVVSGDQSGLGFTPVVDTDYSVVHTLSFTSFAALSAVNIVTTINGIEFGNANVTWENANELRFDIQGNQDGHRIDNLTIATIPEPSTAMLMGLFGFGVLVNRRRR